VAAACVLRAGAALRTKIRTRGGDEVYDWERWLRQELWRKNQPPPQSTEPEQQPQPWQGRDFFVEEVRPAAVALHKFRTGQWEEFAFLSKTNKNKLTKRQRETIVSQLSFLRNLVTGVASAKEGEIAVLDLLLRVEGDDVSSGTLSRYLNEILPLVKHGPFGWHWQRPLRWKGVPPYLLCWMPWTTGTRQDRWDLLRHRQPRPSL
jgi:hypothetical protein